SPVELASQRSPGRRAVGRMGLVGRYAIDLEDTRRPGGRRNQPLAEPEPVLGLGYWRLLHHLGADRGALCPLVSILPVLPSVSFGRAHLAAAHAVGLGTFRDGLSGRPARPSPAVGTEQFGDRTNLPEVCRAALSADAVHLHAGGGGSRKRAAADPRDVAALF